MNQERILLAHGSGGKLTHDLIKDLFLEPFNNPILAELNDSAVFEMEGARIAYTTDSYVVDPIFFNGGDIGKLAVCGTINDLAMSGAQPLYLTTSFIIEEGFPIDSLKRIAASMKETAEDAKVKIVAGDVKVVDAGSADKIFINTSGVGIVDNNINISGSNAQIGDKVIINGYIGDHGIAVLTQREGLNFGAKISSDCAPLNHLVSAILKETPEIHSLRDPTRGGLATTLNELATQSNVGIIIEEEAIPVREEVKGACEMLGFDPLYVANEGKLVAIVAPQNADRILECMRKSKYGKDAQIIGVVVGEPAKTVVLKTGIGGTRIVDMMVGEQLPRIC